VEKLPRALLIDLDDTLLAFTQGAEPCWRAVCAARGPELGIEAERLRSAIRASADAFWADPASDDWGRLDLRRARRAVAAAAFERLGLRGGDASERIADEYTALREHSVELYPDALDLLAAMRSRGVRLALVTNGASDAQRKKIERFDLERRFDAVLIEEELGAGKPDARVFREALARVECAATESWMVGDNLHRDVAGAQGAGITGIWVDRERRGLPSAARVRPDRIVVGLLELLDGF
jgi:putative hydrolase of the HAD superfamily